MNQQVDGKKRRSRWGYALALLALAACGGVVGKPNVGGESHFLRHCGDGCGPGLECVADVCTRGCRVDSGDCTDLAAKARCTNESLEPGELAVCDLKCEASADCGELGAGFACDAGYCRGPAITPPSPGSGGSNSGGNATAGAPNGGGGAPLSGTAGGGGSLGKAGSDPGGNVCQLPFEAGPCKASMEVFAFEGGECRRKIYGGCGGNENRFATLQECENRCGVGTKVPAARCLLPLEPTPCLSDQIVFAFVDGECVSTTCPGNDNSFDTIEQCWSACQGLPRIAACPEGRIAQEVCTKCGIAGGCAEQERLCAQPCDEESGPACARGQVCASGFCQAGLCI